MKMKGVCIMFKLYENTEKELFFEDYKPLPDLDNLSFTEINDLIENLYQAADNACCYHSELLELALCDDIMTVNRKRLYNYLCTVSSGHIAMVIGSTKYSDIDKALLAAWEFYNNAEDENFMAFDTGNADMERIIKEQYQASLAPRT